MNTDKIGPAMGRFFTKTIATAVAILAAAYLFKGIHIDSTVTALLVAIVLGLLNNFVKPLLILLTIPFTILTFGLFLLVINIIIVKWVAGLVPGFTVDGWWPALLFSLAVSFFTAIIEGIIGRGGNNQS